MKSLLSRLLRQKNTTANVTVYSRQNCGCCDKALQTLESFQSRYPLAIEVVDVDSDPALIEAHGLSVPVVEVDGVVRFKGLINPVLLERLLSARRRAD
jgi:hypothetical protein